MSLCTIPYACTVSSAEAICLAIVNTARLAAISSGRNVLALRLPALLLRVEDTSQTGQQKSLRYPALFPPLLSSSGPNSRPWLYRSR